MDATPFHDPVAHMVAWHNRHPLALRITPEDVFSVGVVVLPFVAADVPPSRAWQRWAKLAWDRLSRRAGRSRAAPALRAAFSEDFIAPISPRRVASFALRHGSPQRMGAPELPEREVPTDEGVARGEVLRLYLTTAAVEWDGQRSRVLMGGSEIIGARLWSRRRLRNAAGALGLSLTVLLAGGLWLSGSGPDPAPAAPQAASQPPAAAPPASVAYAPASEPAAPLPVAAADEASSAVEPRPAHVESVASAPAPAPAPAPSAASASKPVVSHPKAPVPDAVIADDSSPEGLPLPARQPLPPALSPTDRAEAVRQARSLRSKTLPAAEPAPGVRVFALVTSLTGTRSAAERRLHLIGLSFAGGKMSGELRSEIMQVDKGWRATLWPFASRAEAQAARDVLEQQGVYTEVVAF